MNSRLISITVNGTPREVPQGTTLADLLRELQLQPKFLAVERNLQVVPRTQHETCQLEDNDELEIVTLVGGG
ncbi:MAG: sulfur carrier protein ThiS [Planctomycetaceae bacterium]